jgi:hypothetical protein
MILIRSWLEKEAILLPLTNLSKIIRKVRKTRGVAGKINTILRLMQRMMKRHKTSEQVHMIQDPLKKGVTSE